MNLNSDVMEMDEKYIFHIPLYKYENGKLLSIEIDDIISELIDEFALNSYENLYMIKAKGFYKSRCFDEILIHIFVPAESKKTMPDEIFKKWFVNNNNILQQEALAYEYNNKLFVEKI